MNVYGEKTCTEQLNKSGEVFRLDAGVYRLQCVHCMQTFLAYDEFVAHIEEHFISQFQSIVVKSEPHEDPIDTELILFDEPFVATADNVNVEFGVKEELPESIALPFASIHQPAKNTCEIKSERKPIYKPKSKRSKPAKPPKSAPGKKPPKYPIVRPVLTLAAQKKIKSRKPRRHFNAGKYCEKCNKYVRDPNHMQMHITADRSYECYLCRKGFPTFYHMSTHIRFRHMGLKLRDVTDFRCLECDLVFKTQNNLYDHNRSMHLQKARNVKCYICARSFTNERWLNDHFLKFHVMPSKYECYICYRDDFDEFHKMRNHLIAEHVQAPSRNIRDAEMNQCQYCGNIFKRSDVLNRHLASQHKEKFAETTCTICQRVYVLKKSYDQHMETNHLDSRTFECHICHVPLATYIALRRHMNSNHIQPWSERPVKFCGKCPTRGECEHLRPLPDGRVECKFCKNIYRRVDYVRKHLRIHFNQIVKCKFCDYSSHLGARVKQHELVRHSLEKPAPTEPCPICKKLYRKSSLKHHINNVHVDPNSRPYICTYCGKGFPTKCRLSIHVIDHKYYGKYQCQLCPKHFARPHLFRDHINKAHDGEGAGDQLN